VRLGRNGDFFGRWQRPILPYYYGLLFVFAMVKLRLYQLVLVAPGIAYTADRAMPLLCRWSSQPDTCHCSRSSTWSLTTEAYNNRTRLLQRGWNLKATFHYSSQLVCSHVFDKVVRVCVMLSTRFRLFCRKPGREPAASISTCRHVEIDAAGSQGVTFKR